MEWVLLIGSWLLAWVIGVGMGAKHKSGRLKGAIPTSLWLEHKRLVANALEQGKTVEWKREDGVFTQFSEVIYHNPDDQIVVVNTDDGPVTVKYEQLTGVRLDGSGDMEVVS